MLTQGDKKIYQLFPGDLILVKDHDLMHSSGGRKYRAPSLRIDFWKSFGAFSSPLCLTDNQYILIIEDQCSFGNNKKQLWVIVNYFSSSPRVGFIHKNDIYEDGTDEQYLRAHYELIERSKS